MLILFSIWSFRSHHSTPMAGLTLSPSHSSLYDCRCRHCSYHGWRSPKRFRHDSILWSFNPWAFNVLSDILKSDWRISISHCYRSDHHDVACPHQGTVRVTRQYLPHSQSVDSNRSLARLELDLWTFDHASFGLGYVTRFADVQGRGHHGWFGPVCSLFYKRTIYKTDRAFYQLYRYGHDLEFSSQRRADLLRYPSGGQFDSTNHFIRPHGPLIYQRYGRIVGNWHLIWYSCRDVLIASWIRFIQIIRYLACMIY